MVSQAESQVFWAGFGHHMLLSKVCAAVAIHMLNQLLCFDYNAIHGYLIERTHD